MKRQFIIGSRGSDLALWQANFIASQLHNHAIKTEIRIIKTKGDQVQDLSFDKMEGKGFFTKELEEALTNKEIDLAVHSFKDLETQQPGGLVIGAVSYREEPNDLLIINKKSYDPKRKLAVKDSAVIGTSSARRKSQILGMRSDTQLKDLRGNVPTRIDKLRKGEYDAILIAAAGVRRLEIDLSEFETELLDPEAFVPAPAQGVLACQVRESDQELLEVLAEINHPLVQEAVGVEREILRLFEGGCQMPVGVYCKATEDDEGIPLYKVTAARSLTWDKPPVLIYLESKNRETLPAKVVDKFNQVQPCKVFITRNLRKDDQFANLLTANKFQVYGKALIQTKLLDIQGGFKKEEIGWVFFSSKQAVKYFFMQKPQLDNVKFGALGKGTAYAIRKAGKNADFVGYSTDTRMTGKQFAATVGNAKVLFPQAKGSMRTIQQQFYNKEQVVNLLVYETILHENEPIPPAETLLFTSPSNVQAFFKNNTIEANQKIIAMGGATGKELKNFGIHQCKLPSSFTDAGLAQAVFGY